MKKQNLKNILILIIIGYNGTSGRKYTIIVSDLERLAKEMIFYFYCIIKNFKFVDFYDKEFTDACKLLIKDKEEFERFLSYINLEVEEFIHLSIYICQMAFTSNLIKFVQTNYLGIEPKKEKPKSKVKRRKI